MAERKPTQELLELDVGEISLVDVPANEQKFHVIKRHEEPKMADEPTTTEPTTSDPVAPNATSAPPEGNSGTPEVITKTFADLQTDYAELEEAYAKVEKIDAGKAANLLNQMMGLMGQMRSALKAGPGKPPPPGGVVGGTSSKTQKDANGADADPAPAVEPPLFSVDAQGGVHFSGEQISKGRLFTASRTATVKSTLTSLAMLLKEVDPVGLVELLDKLKADLPKDPGFTSAVRPVATGPGLTPPRQNLRKGDGEGDGDGSEEETEVMKMLKDMGERIEKFEKERNPTMSVEGDGDTADMSKGAGMWDGIL